VTVREGNRNAVLALHFGEGDPGTLDEARRHVAECAECRDHLAGLSQVQEALLGWPDAEPPPGLGERILAAATRSARPAHAPGPTPDALPLLGLLPVMAALVAVVGALGAWLAGQPLWASLEGWPFLQEAVPFGVAVLMVLTAGALGTLALAPALVLESGAGARLAAARPLGLRG
jgi:hypothetical protein